MIFFTLAKDWMQNFDSSEAMISGQTELIQLLQNVKSNFISIEVAETLARDWEMRHVNKRAGSFKQKKVNLD